MEYDIIARGVNSHIGDGGSSFIEGWGGIDPTDYP